MQLYTYKLFGCHDRYITFGHAAVYIRKKLNDRNYRGFFAIFSLFVLSIKCMCACACVCVCACVREREREREREITEVLLSGHSVTFFAAVCWFGFGAGPESLVTVVTTHPLPPVRPRPVNFQQQRTKSVNNLHTISHNKESLCFQHLMADRNSPGR